MTRALVTFPSGSLGRRVLQRLQNDGVEVRAVGGSTEGNDQLDMMVWPRSAAGFAKLLDGCDYAILCGEGGDNTLTEKTVERFSQLIAAAGKTSIKRIVCFASTDVYDPAACAIGTVRETGPYVDKSIASSRANAAMRIEQAVAKAEGTTEFVVLRLPMIFGRDIPEAVQLVHDAWTSGEAIWETARLQGVDVEEAAEMAVRAAVVAQAAGHALNIAGPIAVSTESAVDEIKRLSQILTDDNDTTIRVRPEYPTVPPIFDTQAARDILGARPRKRIWVNLAEILQKIIQDERRAGDRPPVRSGLPPSMEAIQRETKPFQDKRVLLTGASDEVGRLVLALLLKLGADVVAVFDTEEDVEAAQLPEGCTPVVADLKLLRDIRRVAEVASAEGRLDAAIYLDARIFETKEFTDEGLEHTFALNLLAPATLNELLAETLVATPDSRVVNVVNGHFRECPLDLADLQGEIAFSPIPSFGRAQSGRLMLNAAFDKSVEGSTTKVLTVVPGQLRTETWALIDVPRNDPNIGAQEQQRLQGMRDRAEQQMVAPSDAAEQIVDVLFSANPETASERYLSREQARPLPNHVQDVQTVAALWATCHEIAGFRSLDDPEDPFDFEDEWEALDEF